MAWVVAAVTRKLHDVRVVSREELGFGLASGAATCVPWLCCYRALRDGLANVVPIDKLSVLVVVLFSSLVLWEAASRRYLDGMTLIVGRTLVMVVL